MRYVMIQILFAFSIVSTKAQKQTWLEHLSMSLCVNYTEFNVCLPRYITTGRFIYDTLPEAQKACEAHSQCTGVTHEPNNNRFTLRRGKTLYQSRKNETSWTIDPEILSCEYIGLIDWKGNFLYVDMKGNVKTGARKYNNQGVKVNPFRTIKGQVVLNAADHGGSIATLKNGAVRSERAWEPYHYLSISRRNDKVGFKTVYDTFISVSHNNEVNCKAKTFGKTEEFSIYPSDCLKKDDCTQDLPINAKKWKLLNTEYDTDKSYIYEFAPRRVTVQHIDNTRGSTEQSSSFTASRTIAESISYSHTAGVGITLGTEFKAGIPLIGEAKASVQLTADYQFSYGKERTKQTTYSSQYDCVAPPGRNIECIAYLQRIKMTVPYNMTWRSNRNNDCKRYVAGTLTAIEGDKMMMRVYEYE